MDKNYKDGIIKLVEDVMNRYLKRNLQSYIEDPFKDMERNVLNASVEFKKLSNMVMDDSDVIKKELMRIDDAVCVLYTCHPDNDAPTLPDVIPDFEKRIKKLEDRIERLEK